LIGASDIPVLGKVYSVAFVDGTCATLFANCAVDPATSPLPPFAFTSLVDANAASQALADLVLINGPGGNEDDFDSRPDFVNGCPAAALCGILTPYAVDSSSLLTSEFVNYLVEPYFGFFDSVGPQPYARSYDSSSVIASTFAVWTEVAVVPLPGGAPLAISGLAVLAALGWRTRRGSRRGTA
jgi:hypothetical protein